MASPGVQLYGESPRSTNGKNPIAKLRRREVQVYRVRQIFIGFEQRNVDRQFETLDVRLDGLLGEIALVIRNINSDFGVPVLCLSRSI